MRMISEAQRTAMRLGAVMCLLAVPILVFVAVATFPGSSDDEVIWVSEGESEFALPDPGLFGGSTTVYGAGVSDGERPSPADLGCRLLSDDGTERSRAKLSHLTVMTKPTITVDDTTLSPLFEVSHDRGDRVQCDGLDRVTPVGYTASSTFGSSTAIVFMTAASGALVCLVLGVAGVIVLRPRSPA